MLFQNHGGSAKIRHRSGTHLLISQASARQLLPRLAGSRHQDALPASTAGQCFIAIRAVLISLAAAAVLHIRTAAMEQSLLLPDAGLSSPSAP